MFCFINFTRMLNLKKNASLTYSVMLSFLIVYFSWMLIDIWWLFNIGLGFLVCSSS